MGRIQVEHKDGNPAESSIESIKGFWMAKQNSNNVSYTKVLFQGNS